MRKGKFLVVNEFPKNLINYKCKMKIHWLCIWSTCIINLIGFGNVLILLI